MKRLALLALLVGAAVPAQAGAAAPKPPGYKVAYFKVTVDGVQRNSWSTKQTTPGRCGATVTGSGTETVRFTSSPVRLKVMTIKGLSQPVFTKVGGGRVPLPVLPIRGKLQRSGALTSTPVPRDCQGTGGGSIPRDCGTRSVRGKVRFDYVAPDWTSVVSDGGGNADPFRNCPRGITVWPLLLDRDAQNRHVASQLQDDELFDRSLRKLIVIGSGRRTEGPAGASSTTRIRWVVTLYRVG
jgi:hypothetical protein